MRSHTLFWETLLTGLAIGCSRQKPRDPICKQSRYSGGAGLVSIIQIPRAENSVQWPLPSFGEGVSSTYSR